MDIEQRAKRSKSLLENEWFQETMKDLRNQQTKIFVNSAAHELEQREEAHAILRALKSIEVSLQSDVNVVKLIERRG